MLGAGVSLAGAVLTITLNWYWIPVWGYMGSAWATLACYFAMAVISYLLGRRFYPVAYDVKRIFLYVLFGLSLFLAKPLLLIYVAWQPWLLSAVLLSLFLLTATLLESRKSN